ncbi:MAG TPA: hypothetical protein VKX28_26725 [Xanthobacteraceae bacterium]|nr:hypothetical protein [Xanthobacteraceae bacterium]
MPLFMCTKCGCVDNTALAEYWNQERDWLAATANAVARPRFEPQCSQCLTSRWHGQFPRKLAEGYVSDQRGRYIYTPEQAAGSASHMGPFKPVVLPAGASV